jgi:hypothetical protein
VPYARAFHRVTFIHQISGTDEIGLTGLDLTGDTAPTAPLAVGQLNNIVGAYAAFLLKNIRGVWANYSTLVAAKAALIGTDGHYLADPVEATGVSQIAGSATGIVPQATVVVSLRSGSVLGKGNYGRMYIPHSGQGASAEPRMSVALAGGIADDAAVFVEAVNAVGATVAPAAQVRIMSQALPTPQARHVTEVGVGRVVDTQRRRRNALAEETALRAVS